MTQFRTSLLLRPLPGRLWEVKCTFVCDTNTAGLLAVPKGFICDLTSIPRFLWWASTPTDHPEAAVVHDWGYRDKHLPQPLADAVYRELLEFSGMSPFRARNRYWALRAFGRFAYGS